MVITGKTDIETFNHWYEDNYCKLSKYCKKYRIPEDTLHDTYLNIHNRIVKSGYTTTQYMTYIKRSIKNLEINTAKKNNNKFFIDIDCEDYTNFVEEKLIEVDDIEKDTQLYREEIMEVSKKIFKYIDKKNYNDEWKFVFRCYYLMDGRMTYEKLTEMTGLNKNKCTAIIQAMKNDIKQTFQWRSKKY